MDDRLPGVLETLAKAGLRRAETEYLRKVAVQSAFERQPPTPPAAEHLSAVEQIRWQAAEVLQLQGKAALPVILKELRDRGEQGRAVASRLSRFSTTRNGVAHPEDAARLSQDIVDALTLPGVRRDVQPVGGTTRCEVFSLDDEGQGGDECENANAVMDLAKRVARLEDLQEMAGSARLSCGSGTRTDDDDEMPAADKHALWQQGHAAEHEAVQKVTVHELKKAISELQTAMQERMDRLEEVFAEQVTFLADDVRQDAEQIVDVPVPLVQEEIVHELENAISGEGGDKTVFENVVRGFFSSGGRGFDRGGGDVAGGGPGGPSLLRLPPYDQRARISGKASQLIGPRAKTFYEIGNGGGCEGAELGNSSEDPLQKMACESLDGAAKEDPLKSSTCKSLDGVAKEDPLKSMARKSFDGAAKEDPLKSMACKSLDSTAKEVPLKSRACKSP